MSAQGQLLRQFHTVLRLQQAKGAPVPFAELQRYLLTQTSVGDFGSYSQRMLQRDIELIPENFGLTILCRRNRGYYISETEPLLPGHQKLLEAFALQEFLRLPEALGALVQPETRQPLGLEHLRPLLRAAQARQVVELDYLKHWEAEPQRRTVGPLLRESRGRWYVLGQMAGSGRLACFGLDRIRQLTVTETGFTAPPDFDPATYFAHCFGITRPTDGQPPETIRLRFEPTQGRYALSYPLHASQQVEAVSDAAIDLRLTVYDTHELRMELLSYGAAVEVLAPAALRDWLRGAHEEAAGTDEYAATTAP